MLPALVGGCAKTYYDAMEKVGIHKRDILADRVKDARDSQVEAQQQFKSALEQFASVIRIEDTDLKKAYEKLNAEYEDCEKAAKEVSSRIDRVESVADALFDEWKGELNAYKSADLRETSRKQLETTRSRYRGMLASMHQAEKSMEPVLGTFYDNVLFLKHNLNAQAIASLKVEFAALRGKIDGLVKKMNDSIESSNTFIANLK
jgi:DNA repair exonuclease SbcCD ATPase subunit